MSLIEYASERSNWNLIFSRDDGCVNRIRRFPGEFNVAAFLADLSEAGNFQTAFDFAEGERPKPPQPRPRQCALWAAG